MRLPVPTSTIIATTSKHGSMHVLVLEMKRYNGKLVLPGGGLDVGEETMVGCARREFHEETGQKLEEVSLLLVNDDPERDVRHNMPLGNMFDGHIPEAYERLEVEARYCLDFVYTGHFEETAPLRSLDGEADHIRYYDLADFKEEDFAVGHGAYLSFYVETLQNKEE